MGYNDRDGNRSYGGGSYQREMHDAVCSECGKQTQVPFKPKADLPVYCKECYMKKKGGGKSYNRRDSEE